MSKEDKHTMDDEIKRAVDEFDINELVEQGYQLRIEHSLINVNHADKLIEVSPSPAVIAKAESRAAQATLQAYLQAELDLHITQALSSNPMDYVGYHADAINRIAAELATLTKESGNE